MDDRSTGMRTYRDINVVEAARERMAWLFAEFPNVVVCSSGGKDSTVVLELALEAARAAGRLPLNVMFLDQEAEWECVIQHMRGIMTRDEVKPCWYQVPFRMSNSTSALAPWLNAWDPAAKAKWMHPQESYAVTVNRTGKDRFHEMFAAILATEWPGVKTACLTGMRGEESPNRLLAVTHHLAYKWVTWGKRERKVKGDYYTMHPIYDWTLGDVWRSILDNGWRYCTPAETPIWMGDHTFKRIEQVRPGEQVMGWTAAGERRSRLARATVEATASRRAEVVKITMASGRTLRATADHRWLRTSPGQEKWHIGTAKVGDDLAFVVAPRLDGAVQQGRFRTRDRIVSIEPDGVEPVYCLQTSLGNYVAWGYASSNCPLYDHLYRYGMSDRAMRVSNVHHETSVQTLFFLQEIEPRTWERLTQRLEGIDMAGKLGIDDYWVRTLPPMFASWREYRDYLLENLVTVPEWREAFARKFATMDRIYGAASGDELPTVQIQSILTNDWEFVKLNNWSTSPKRMLVRTGKVDWNLTA